MDNAGRYLLNTKWCSWSNLQIDFIDPPRVGQGMRLQNIWKPACTLSGRRHLMPQGIFYATSQLQSDRLPPKFNHLSFWIWKHRTKSHFRDPKNTKNSCWTSCGPENPPQPIRNSNGSNGSVRAHEDGGGAHEHRHGGHWDHHSDVSIHGSVEMDRHGWENLYVWKELEILVLDREKKTDHGHGVVKFWKAESALLVWWRWIRWFVQSDTV